MSINDWLPTASTKRGSLYYKLLTAFTLIFIIPGLGFVYYALSRGLLSDSNLALFFLIFLVSSLCGFIILRRLFDEIAFLSRDLSESVSNEISGVKAESGVDEIKNIVNSFSTFQNQFRTTFHLLERRVNEITVLKELSDLCYVTVDPEELLYVTLERALKLAGANVGSILLLHPEKGFFTVTATIGLGGHIKIGDKVDFETSIAKYAIINKAPLIIDNIEEDGRFGRVNRPQYGSKSFVCLPIKTIRDIIGVLTVSNRKGNGVFTNDDVEMLIPLLSNAAFTYENLRLIREKERGKQFLSTLDRLFKGVNSSLMGDELYQMLLKELNSVMSLERAVVAIADENTRGLITLAEFIAASDAALARSSSYRLEGSILERSIKQKQSLVISDEVPFSHEADRELIGLLDGKVAFAAPLMMAGEVKGLFVAVTSGIEILGEDREFLERMADVLSLAVEKSLLSATVEKRVQELDALQRIGGALATSTFDTGQVLSYTMDMIRTAMDVEAGALFLLKGDDLVFTTAFSMDMERLRDFRLKLGQGIAGYVASRGETIIENDIPQSHLFRDAPEIGMGFPMRSVLSVPMISQGKMTGVIQVVNKTKGLFGSTDERLLQSIAASVSIAIDNARLYSETVTMAEQERGIRQMFQKFVPAEIVEKIIHNGQMGEALLEEFRTLTLLNIDIRGFSGLALTLGPQKTVSLLNYFFSVMGDIVFSHHGIVDKYLGDGFLALFGAPLSSPADADHAITAALMMRRAMESVNRYARDEVGTELIVGISIHTGEVVVGNIGFDKKMDYTVIGDSVNTVFQLQSLTRDLPNGIVISEKTIRAAQRRRKVRDIKLPEGYSGLGGMAVYELIDDETG
ncbi:MAG: GAF domain-containing protein [Deltaproteobacteria bacterium]|nr:GAF domain-containing protein [Deltaproteobacteria bacterium]